MKRTALQSKSQSNGLTRKPLQSKPREVAKSREKTRHRAKSHGTISVQVTGPVRAKVYERDGRRCQACGSTGPLNVQHRAARGMGGTRDPLSVAASNLVCLCGSGSHGCHGKAELNPTWAAEQGWRVPTGTVAALHPYRRFDGQLVLLADDWTIRLLGEAA